MVLAIPKLVRLLEEEYGDPDWWPAESPFEVAVGAILTQRASWSNVERAIEALRKERMLTPSGLLAAERDAVERLVRPTGFYKQKTDYLVAFASHMEREYGGDIRTMLRKQPDRIREELLQLKGVGPETADSILLYALAIPSFVVDAYTIRILARLGIYGGRGYDSIKKTFENAFDNDVASLAMAHALIVIHCKKRCRATPDCDGCPLAAFCRSEPEEKE